ncbi:hypothetical protein ABT56_19215 [Photobacterium aquae]|uniref:Thioredoxin-like fold domain-containing protein n=1 Tax=Photobacterium aquae TaxID=1195763 RepID=A0A0J1GVT2_9GAMM|nr:thioredoxin domain-containing protein [Photobacterium aquae]KLV03559.1 hypothetical protein ABT56_19215 [Photobacterium aquae]
MSKIKVFLVSLFLMVTGSVQATPQTQLERVQVTIYSDYLCRYCREQYSVLKSLPDAILGVMDIEYRDYPIRGKASNEIAIMMNMIKMKNEQAYHEIHDQLMMLPMVGDRSDVEAFVRLSSSYVGLDEIAPYLSNASDKVDTDLRMGRSAGITVTPTLFINGTRFDGMLNADQLIEALSYAIN